ncbi:MAG TPA: DUF1360 domain-containing protein [Pyrinomonadaceae bacterium]|jgi:hypothetical protein|nr:DUF1360 domain-containing protein [Pyrinomonadaceae bacterium]
MKKDDKGQSLQKQQSDAELFAGYNGGEEMPLAGYAVLLGIYNTAFLTLLLTAENSEKGLPERINLADLLLLGVATHKLSRIIAKDRVTSPLRAPFTEYVEPAGESEIKEKVRGRGIQRAIGDLLTCPFCMSPWVAAGLAFGFVFKPRATRVIAGVFAAATVSEFLHRAADAAKEK